MGYTLAHVDVDWHDSFPLSRRMPVVPTVTLPVTNVTRLVHRAGEVFVLQPPNYTRVALKGEWT